MRVWLVLALAAMSGSGHELTRVLILTGSSDPAHDWRSTTRAIERILEDPAGFSVSRMESPSFTADDLAKYDVLVLNYNGPRWPAQSERAVEAFVASGRSLLSFHGVTYGPLLGQRMVEGRWIQEGPGWAAYPQLLGAIWRLEDLGHGTRHAFEVDWANQEHPVAKGLGARFMANDELYHRLTLLPGTCVLATAFSSPGEDGTGKHEPIIWAAPFGKGRTVHTTLGHDARALEQSGLAAAIRNAVLWLAHPDTGGSTFSTCGKSALLQR